MTFLFMKKNIVHSALLSCNSSRVSVLKLFLKKALVHTYAMNSKAGVATV